MGKRKGFKKGQRYDVLAKTLDKCSYCGCDITLKNMQVDHYYPVSLSSHYMFNFGIDVHHHRNLLATCRTCNHYKRADTPEEFRVKMSTLHERIENIYINKVGKTFNMVTINKFSGYLYFEYLMFGIESHNMSNFPIHPAINDQSFFDKIEETFNL